MRTTLIFSLLLLTSCSLSRTNDYSVIQSGSEVSNKPQLETGSIDIGEQTIFEVTESNVQVVR